MNCKEVVEALVDYYDTGCDPALAHAIETHLEHCPPCEAITRTYGATIHLTWAAFAQAADPAREEALTRRVMARIRRRA